MFGDSKNAGKEIETIVGPSVSLRGKLKSDGNIRIQGKISGEVKTKNDIFIAENASVKASVSAKNIVIAGEVDGDVSADGEIEITETGKVCGNINAKALIIKMGAIFIGKSSMEGEVKKEVSKEKKSPEPEPELAK